MIRTFRFKNSFLSEKIEPVSAEYSVFGPYDGLDMTVYYDFENDDSWGSLGDTSRMVLKEESVYEKCDIYPFIGMRGKDDKIFWEKGGEPYIFISSIRLCRKSDILEKVISNLEDTFNAVCYTSFDSNDLIICIRRSSYAGGYSAINMFENEIRRCDPYNGIKKGFTVFCICQEVLDGIAGISVSKEAEEEISRIVDEPGITSILYGIIKDKTELPRFLSEIEKSLCGVSTDIYGILGREDIAIKLKNFHFKDYLRLYGNEQLLTHADSLYRKIFYNVRTEIWCGF